MGRPNLFRIVDLVHPSWVRCTFGYIINIHQDALLTHLVDGPRSHTLDAIINWWFWEVYQFCLQKSSAVALMASFYLRVMYPLLLI